MQCVRGCPGRYDVFEVIYRCPTCGGLLEVVHDVEALRGALRRRSGATCSTPGGPPRRRGAPPGVWSKAEWVLPQLAPENIVTLGEGFTPLLPSPRLARDLGIDDLWVKQCGISHTGSFKDLGMTVLVSAVAQMMAERRQPGAGGGLRLDRRHLGGAGGLRRGRRHPGDRVPAARQDQHRPTDPADRQRRARAGARHRLRRLHAHRPAR